MVKLVKLLDVFVKRVLQNRAVPSAVLVTEALLLDSVGLGSPICKPASAPPLNTKLASSEQADAVQGDLAPGKCPPDAELCLNSVYKFNASYSSGKFLTL